MNKCESILSGMATCLLFASSALAQDAIVHQVAFPQGDATWSVTAQNPEKPDAPSGPGATTAAQLPKKFVGLDIVCQGNLRRDMITWSDGTTDQMWWLRDLPYALAERGGHVECMKVADMGQVIFDASSFAWVSAKAYKGKKPYQGNDSQYYETKLFNPGVPDQAPLTLRAWIDPVTHLPLALYNGFIEVSFSFPKAARIPTLQMPANFQQKYDELKSFYAKMPPKSG